MTDAPRKPLWKRKRWIAAAVLWVVIAYPLSLGPVAYANARGWVPPPAVRCFEVMYSPLDGFITSDLPGSGPLSRYTLWLYQLVQRDAAAF